MNKKRKPFPPAFKNEDITPLQVVASPAGPENIDVSSIFKDETDSITIFKSITVHERLTLPQ